MDGLEQEAAKHFQKLEKSLEYHEKRLQGDLPKGIKYAIQCEIDMLKFVRELAKEALAARGISV